MIYSFTCPFSIISSHEILTRSFQGRNSVKLQLPVKIDSPLGIVGTTLLINEKGDDGYLFHVTSNTLNTEKCQINFLQKIALHISLRLGLEEVNPHYGTLFLKPAWHQLESIESEFNGRSLSDSLSIKSVLTLDISTENFLPLVHPDLFRFYYDGLRAAHLKSKYFHFFLIFEYLENSPRYKSLFEGSKLFDAEETEIIQQIANRMSNTKKSAILKLLTRTEDSREIKILKLIQNFGIARISVLGQSKDVDLAMIKNITKNRNRLFHSGADFPAEALWGELFQLATLVVAHISRTPECLDA